MIPRIQIGEHVIGPSEPCFVIAEIGINHNGSVDIAKQLITVAKAAGCQAVKFQKRTVDVVYSAEELAKPRENPFGPTNGHLKRGLEFGREQYDEIDAFCKEQRMLWTASCWDEQSVEFIASYGVSFFKVASASLTDDALLRKHREHGAPIILSTGMSTLDEIDHAVDTLGKQDLALLHCTSTYPSKPEELNLSAIGALYQRYSVPIGYSGHETGLTTTVAAVAMWACIVERHITLDRSMWGSDQGASVEPHGLMRMVRDIRVFERARGDGFKVVYDSEQAVKGKLRRVG